MEKMKTRRVEKVEVSRRGKETINKRQRKRYNMIWMTLFLFESGMQANSVLKSRDNKAMRCDYTSGSRRTSSLQVTS